MVVGGVARTPEGLLGRGLWILRLRLRLLLVLLSAAGANARDGGGAASGGGALSLHWLIVVRIVVFVLGSAEFEHGHCARVGGLVIYVVVLSVVDCSLPIVPTDRWLGIKNVFVPNGITLNDFFCESFKKPLIITVKGVSIVSVGWDLIRQ